MKTRHIKVTGHIARPLPDSKADQATHSLVLTDKQYETYVNQKYFKVVDGTPQAKTSEEVEASQLADMKVSAKNSSFTGHREVVQNMRVRANDEIYRFDIFSMFFFFAEYVSKKDVGFEWKPKGKPERMHSAQEVQNIFEEARKTIRDSFSAYNFDRLEILNNNDFSNSNVEAELAKQRLIK